MALAQPRINDRSTACEQKIQLLLEAGIERHQQGQLASANLIYEQIRELDPENAIALQLSGVLAGQVEQHDVAIVLLSRAISLKPNYSEALNNRGIIYKKIGRLDEALADYSKAISLNPKYADALYNRGIIFQELNQISEALEDYSRVISLKPSFLSAINNRGLILRRLERFDEALADFNKIIYFDKKDTEALNSRGSVHKDLGHIGEALADYNQALELNPNYVEALNNRGIINMQIDEYDKALADFERVLSIEPNSFETLNNHGNILKELGRQDEALADYDKAISLKPDFVAALKNRGNVHQELRKHQGALEDFDKALFLKSGDYEILNSRGLIFRELGQHEKALLEFGQAISIKPDYAEAHSNRGISLEQLGQYDEALADYDKAISLKPDYAEPYLNKSLQMLLFGNFASGWPLYEWRWKIKHNIGKELTTSKPMWQGEKDSNVFLWAEQGIGDEIMFASLIPELEERCLNLIVKCDERLIPLFKRSFSQKTSFHFEQNKVTEDSYDFHIPIASLPFILRPSLDSFNQASNAYLHCDSKKAEELRKIILEDNVETLIGISWNSSAAQPGSHHRNITLSDLAKHLHAPGVKLVNLQYGDVSDEITKLKDDHGIEIIEMLDVDNRNDIDGLAALIMACDEVVSIDNATVHLAGALGAKTRILLPFNRNWQWGTSGSSSYWYNSVELYRQQAAGDWKQVLQQLKIKNLFLFPNE